MDKKHAMTIRKFIATSVLTILATALVAVPMASALDMNFDFATTDSDAANGDVTSDMCANLDESLAAAMGCDTTDQITDFTEYTGKLEGPDAAGYDDALTQTSSAREFIQTIVNFALSFLGLVATVIVIYGGIMYVLSRGDEEMATKGKKAIGYAAMGIVMILASFALVNTLLSATGGGVDSVGGGAEGTTITEAGASFDVDGVQSELLDIMNDYLEAYETLLYTSQEIAYLKSIEMPLSVTVIETDKTLSGYIEYGTEWLNGTDSELTDEYTLIDENDIDEYIDDIREGIRKVQSEVDSLSDTYEASQILYDYLRSGGSTSAIIDWIGALIAPEASAKTKDSDEETTSCEALSYSGEYTEYDPATIAAAMGIGAAAVGTVAGVGTATLGGLGTTAGALAAGAAGIAAGLVSIAEGIGTTAYDTQVSYIDDAICPMLEVIEYTAGTDYQEEVDLLLDRFEDLMDLFDTSAVAETYTSGSSLYQVVQALEDARSYMEAARDGVNNSTMRDIVNSINELYSMIENIEFVRVKLTASAIKGNAPLIVRFDALGTEDPSGKTVQDEQIDWDLDGNGDFTDDTYDENGIFVGATTAYTYTEPGTYRARVRVRSSDYDIAAGVAEVTIQVESPRSILKLEATAGGEKTVLADFSTYPAIDQNTYKVTMSEAQSGILFDASGSTDGDGNATGLIFAEWDFGDSESASGSWSQYSSYTHYYGEEGVYNVSLTVTDETGVKDRKYFKLYVASPAAKLYTYPESGEVGTTFKFDGSGSSTDVGTIVSYQWSAKLDGNSYELSSTSGSVINETLTEPGVYTVTLTVVDSSSNTDSVSTNVLVESQAPVATFTYEKPSNNEPAQVEFDASDSYDPDKEDTITYQWEIDGAEGEDYEVIEGSLTSEKMALEFLAVDDYKVKLTVSDQHEEELQKSASTTKTVNITSILDVNMEVQGENARHLDGNGESEVEFYAYSDNASAFEIAYGDGETDFTENISNGQAIFTHVYDQAGVFYAKVTAYDDNGNTNSVTHRVYIATGDAPIAVINVSADGEDIGFGESLSGSVKTQFTFDASESLNVDGSKSNLRYSWNFGDGSTASQSKVTHVFDEEATYTVVLTVRDKEDSSVTNETYIYITIQGIPPEIHNLSVTPQGDSLETPLKVTINVDADDEDGKINYVKAWYYDVTDSATQLGTVIAQSTSFSMTVNTKGESGEVIEYAFAVEVTDNSNNTVSSFEELSTDRIPTLKVTNGPNESPVANFSVDRSSVYIGEEVTFSSTSYDPDGSIVSYWWDIEGDGFYNNEPTTEGSYTYAFEKIHPDGVNVKLKVEDDTGATATSDELTIYVDSIADAPDAKFLAYVDGTEVSFQNNSFIDTENGAEIAGIYWDFDLDYDSDGNAVKDDDYDSSEENPEYSYDDYGQYRVRMTIVDSMGQKDSVEQTITVSNSAPPTANFSFTVDAKDVTFKNSSSVDEENGAEIREYIWDFDSESEDDVNSSRTHPSYEYEDYGVYSVKLTVVDTLGKTDSVTKTVEVESPIQGLQALLTSAPVPNEDGQIEADSDPLAVTFYYSSEGGDGDYFTYRFDNNIFYDSDGDGVKENDIDYQTNEPGTWKVTYYESYGQIVAQLTVIDQTTGEEDSATLQVVFEGTLGSANLLAMTPNTFIMFILCALAAVLFGVSFTYQSKPISK